MIHKKHDLILIMVIALLSVQTTQIASRCDCFCNFSYMRYPRHVCAALSDTYAKVDANQEALTRYIKLTDTQEEFIKNLEVKYSLIEERQREIEIRTTLLEKELTKEQELRIKLETDSEIQKKITKENAEKISALENFVQALQSQTMQLEEKLTKEQELRRKLEVKERRKSFFNIRIYQPAQYVQIIINRNKIQAYGETQKKLIKENADKISPLENNNRAMETRIMQIGKNLANEQKLRRKLEMHSEIQQIFMKEMTDKYSLLEEAHSATDNRTMHLEQKLTKEQDFTRKLEVDIGIAQQHIEENADKFSHLEKESHAWKNRTMSLEEKLSEEQEIRKNLTMDFLKISIPEERQNATYNRTMQLEKGLIEEQEFRSKLELTVAEIQNSLITLIGQFMNLTTQANDFLIEFSPSGTNSAFTRLISNTLSDFREQLSEIYLKLSPVSRF